MTLLAAPVLAADAGAWPEHPTRLVVPFPAGGQFDVVSRLIAERIALALGQPVVVEVRPGADGNILDVAWRRPRALARSQSVPRRRSRG